MGVGLLVLRSEQAGRGNGVLFWLASRTRVLNISSAGVVCCFGWSVGPGF